MFTNNSQVLAIASKWCVLSWYTFVIHYNICVISVTTLCPVYITIYTYLSFSHMSYIQFFWFMPALEQLSSKLIWTESIQMSWIIMLLVNYAACSNWTLWILFISNSILSRVKHDMLISVEYVHSHELDLFRAYRYYVIGLWHGEEQILLHNPEIILLHNPEIKCSMVVTVPTMDPYTFIS